MADSRLPAAESGELEHADATPARMEDDAADVDDTAGRPSRWSSLARSLGLTWLEAKGDRAIMVPADDERVRGERRLQSQQREGLRAVRAGERGPRSPLGRQPGGAGCETREVSGGACQSH